MPQPTRSSTRSSSRAHASAKPARTGHARTPAKPVAPADGLHYSKDDLHADYTRTYGAFMKALAIGIFGALLYFFVMIIYLGAWGHTPTDDYVREFGSRIQYDYKGLRLPQYDDPSLVEKPVTGASH
jgi:hypothetical protein